MPQAGQVWRNYEEVFDLAVSDHGLLAATNGGLLELESGRWVAVPSPTGLRSIVTLAPLAVDTASGKSFRVRWPDTAVDQRGSERERAAWRQVADTQNGRPDTLKAAPGRRTLSSPLAGVTGHVYAKLESGGASYAGTSNGLWRGRGGSWTREALPSKLPGSLSRPNGLAVVSGQYVIGGLGGFFTGRPGDWTEISADAIRQVCAQDGQAWVVHGNGALDRVDVATGRLYPDILAGAAPRAWTSCIGQAGKTLLFGGQGGWVERSNTLVPHFPPELKDDVVLSITGRDTVRWIGTEQSGVLRFGPTGIHRFNPGNGLTDTWVTSLLLTPSGLFVGTLHAGLFRIVGDRVEPLSSPTRRVTQLGLWNGALVVGGMDGAWIRSGPSWKPLGTGSEETTCVSTEGHRLVVTTVAGVYFF
jgi:hypothetical protein